MPKRFAALLLLLLCALMLSLNHAPALPASSDGGVAVPIIMYHSLRHEPQHWGDYVLSPAVFASDMRYLKAQGYEPVWIADLIAHVEQGAPLPAKPVVITFDDGHLNVLTEALPVLQALNMKASVAVVGAYTRRAEQEADPAPAYAYCTWEDLRTLHASGLIELTCHSDDLHAASPHRGATRAADEPASAYRARLTADTLALTEQTRARLGVSMTCYVFPFGFCDREGEAALRALGFRASLSCMERVNLLTSSADCLWHMGRFNRPSGVSTETFFRQILPIVTPAGHAMLDRDAAGEVQ